MTPDSEVSEARNGEAQIAKRTKHRDRNAFRNYIYNTLKIDKDWLKAQVKDAVKDLLKEELDERLGCMTGPPLVEKLLRDVIREDITTVLLGVNYSSRGTSDKARIHLHLEKILLEEIKTMLAQRFKLSVNMELVEPEPKVDRTVIAPYESFRGVREV